MFPFDKLNVDVIFSSEKAPWFSMINGWPMAMDEYLVKFDGELECYDDLCRLHWPDFNSTADLLQTSEGHECRYVPIE